MVNDQLIRIHHLRLLSQEKMLTKDDGSPRSSLASSPQLSPTIDYSKAFSSSAPENSFANTDEHDGDDDSLNSKHALLDDDNKKRRRKRFQPASKSQNSSPVRYDFIRPVKKQDNAENAKRIASTVSSGKRRSSWRHILSPSYRSRSDEFHKLFCDEIPKTERLVADYSCALHREILIQGRVYVSINYIAFYSNLFSWITKLVVKLRDVTEIYKANTARFIPNAIQLMTNKGEKHVFASFLARDKSFIMISRMWKNNLLKERMSDQEIRSLVHCGYGKDLGMSDNEEFKINSPDPKSPAHVPADKAHLDSNNNTDQKKRNDKIETVECSYHLENSLEPPPQRAPSPLDLSDDFFGSHPFCKDGSPVGGHARYNSVDYQMKSSRGSEKNQVVQELVRRLNELSDSSHSQGQDQTNSSLEDMDLNNKNEQNCSPAASSAVVVDTPNSLYSTARNEYDFTNEQCLDECSDEAQLRVRKETNFISPDKTEASENKGSAHPNDHQQSELANPKTGSSETVVDDAISKHEIVDGINLAGLSTSQAGYVDHDDDQQLSDGWRDAACGCDQHEGLMIADEIFDIDVDSLFSLIFTNSKFMRAHMVKRGIFDAIISQWKRSNQSGKREKSSTSGDKSTSSTLSSDGRRGSIESHANGTSISSDRSGDSVKFKVKQVRQLNYSLNINHILAKKVEVNERQKICSIKPGVYVLKSISLNSGIPYSEAFSIDITYCLTRLGQANKSRMLVHCVVNFKKEKHSWKLALVKSTIEKSSMTGVSEFISDLVDSIKDFIENKKRKKKSNESSQVSDERRDASSWPRRSRRLVASECRNNNVIDVELRSSVGSLAGQAVPKTKGGFDKQHMINNSNNNISSSPKSDSAVQAKSRLKERKIRSMYKYYISNDSDHDDTTTGGGETSALSGGNRRRHRKHSDDSSEHCSSDISLEDSSMLIHGCDDEANDNASMVMMMKPHGSDSQRSDADGPSVDHPSSRCRSRASQSRKVAKLDKELDLGGPLSERSIIVFIIVTSLILTIFVLSLWCAVIVQRLDSIENQLRQRDICVGDQLN